MHVVYLACLFGGFVATVLLAVLGTVGGVHSHVAVHSSAPHIPAGHVPAGPGHPTGFSTLSPGQSNMVSHPALPTHHGAIGSHQNHPSGTQAITTSRLIAPVAWLAPWLSPLILAAAALWFGAAGVLVETAVPVAGSLIVIVLAVVAAVVGAFLVRVLQAAFVRASTPPLQSSVAGSVGTLNVAIRPNAAGEVIYTLDGLRCSAPARSETNATLARGTDVVILRRENGIAWVAPLDPLSVLDRSGDLSPPP